MPLSTAKRTYVGGASGSCVNEGLAGVGEGDGVTAGVAAVSVEVLEHATTDTTRTPLSANPNLFMPRSSGGTEGSSSQIEPGKSYVPVMT
jgi:hypothetical protein